MSLLLDLLPLFKRHVTPGGTGGRDPYKNPLPRYIDHPVVRITTRKSHPLEMTGTGGRVYGASSTETLHLQGSAIPKSVTAGRSTGRHPFELVTVRATPVVLARTEQTLSLESRTSGYVAYGSSTRASHHMELTTLRAERAMDPEYQKRSDEEALALLAAL